VLLVPAGWRHREESDFMDILWVGLHGTLLDRLPRDRVIAVRGEEPLEWCERLWNRAERRFGRIGAELDGLALVVLNQILRGTEGSGTQIASHIEEAAAYLRQNFDRDLPLPDVARRFGYSEGHFYREFHRHTGTTPVRYLTTIRIQHATHWLTHTRTAVGKVAQLVGYRDPLYFSRVFRQATGRRPSDCRR
jgi:AraC-like DNA-binding protein